MDPYKEWLRKNKATLAESTVNIPDLMRHLDSKGLLSETTKAEIKAEPGPVLQAEELYTHLRKYGQAKVATIIDCLMETDNEHIAAEFNKWSQASGSDAAGPQATAPKVPEPGKASAGSLFSVGYGNNKDLLKIQDLVVKDERSSEKWPKVIDRIVLAATDKLAYKRMIDRHLDYDEAVLKSLQAWNSHGKVDLLQVLRDLDMDTLADQIQAA